MAAEIYRYLSQPFVRASPRSFGQESWQRKSTDISSLPPSPRDAPPSTPGFARPLPLQSQPPLRHRCRVALHFLIAASVRPQNATANLPPSSKNASISKLPLRLEGHSPLGCGI